MGAFSSKTVIHDHKELFGRDDVINQLISLANNGNSVAVIGHRRFGKSSVLQSVKNLLLNTDESKVHPVYLDFKEVGSVIKGTPNVYRYMISKFVVSLNEKNIFRKDKVEIKKTIIESSSDWEDIFESLQNVNNVRIQGVFEEIIEFFAEYMEKSILLIIDEYEWLFRFSFDEPVGFMKLRNFASRPGKNGIHPFSFWIAGCMPWDKLCSITGSPELNVIDAPIITIGNISYNSFSEMWKNELNKLIDQSNILDNSVELVYELVGGIPFFGKLIGAHLLTSNKKPTFNLLVPHFEDLYRSLTSEEQKIVNYLSNASRSYKNSIYLNSLIENGIITQTGKIFKVSSSLFQDFLNSNGVESTTLVGDKIPESELLMNKIAELIMDINKTNHNKFGIYIFDPVVDELALMKDLSTPCRSIEIFADFASSIYKIVFERTKDNNVVLKKLPKKYKRGYEFIDIIDIMRHSLGGGHLMDNFSLKNGQMTKGKMLELLTGSRNEPNKPEDYYSLQLLTLKRFIVELKQISAFVRTKK